MDQKTREPGHLTRAMQRVRGPFSARHRVLIDTTAQEEAERTEARHDATRRDDLLDGAFACGTVQDNGKPVTR
jgi:hypothetical protein